MGRKRPHELRAADASSRDPVDADLLGRVTYRPALSPGHEHRRRLALVFGAPTAQALEQWSTVCHHTRATLNWPCNDWTELIGPHARDVLAEALTALPPRQARRLGRCVARLDAMFLDKTVQNPREDPGLPWWCRRTARG